MKNKLLVIITNTFLLQYMHVHVYTYVCMYMLECVCTVCMCLFFRFASKWLFQLQSCSVLFVSINFSINLIFGILYVGGYL